MITLAMVLLPWEFLPLEWRYSRHGSPTRYVPNRSQCHGSLSVTAVMAVAEERMFESSLHRRT